MLADSKRRDVGELVMSNATSSKPIISNAIPVHRAQVPTKDT